jgi:hypothetical protein
MPDKNLDRFKIKLREQVGFLQRSGVLFDGGFEEEAFRIATALRVLFHDTNKSTSLLNHIGAASIKMLSTSRGHFDYRDYLSTRIDLTSPQPIRMIPMLGTRFKAISVDEWWKSETVFCFGGLKYFRKHIVLSAANKDGGAHVDSDLEKYYTTLSSGIFSFGITGNLTYVGAPPFKQGVTQYANNAHLALLRQFGHEAVESLKNM